MEKEKLASLRQDHMVTDPGVVVGDGDWGQGRRARKGPGASHLAIGQESGAGGVPLAAPSLQHPPSLAEAALLQAEMGLSSPPIPGLGERDGGDGPCRDGGLHPPAGPCHLPGDILAKPSTGTEQEGCKTSWWYPGWETFLWAGSSVPCPCSYRPSIREGCREL